ncbi:MAG: 16S rRNA (guanine(966)-N(2))-methyltransferase RsmD [Albidovulum sp.]|nr:16S rRNA (guanine(966)-N(2))-methyltransferase RsmD [Albidovulum sp.]MDE0307257.1 16S rRNA (guanine(966)-N(2))-methyltransferase RsmD [Albidovulum sp.]MDE0532270.1 16S rRNA (guanine(966)-N(2))-methyltransferase RsmD [Albidovulum sp.]
MIKVIGGIYRGRNLAKIGDNQNLSLRPTSSRVRESIFNMLVNGKKGNLVEGARVLDLFAGTGALGIEALSRRAAHVTFVEIESASCNVIRRNIELVGASERTALLKRDACRLGKNKCEPFDLVLLDPPYGLGLGVRSLKSVLANGWLAVEGVAVIEEIARPDLGKEMEEIETKKYGDTTVVLYQRKLEASP